MKQNMNFVCAMCGKEDMPGFVGSRLILEAGYGSVYDCERVTVPICGECCDKLHDELARTTGAQLEDYPVGCPKSDLLLDDETRRSLNDGKTVVLDGGYLITSPDTMQRMSELFVIETLKNCKDDKELRAGLIDALMS